jgi:hypothetical protein
MSTAWSSEPFGARRGRPFRADAGGYCPSPDGRSAGRLSLTCTIIKDPRHSVSDLGAHAQCEDGENRRNLE